MRGVAIALGAGMALVLAAITAFYLMIIRPVEQVLAPATPENARVDLLEGGADALILMPFVTGDVPRLVTGAALRAQRPQLWYIDDADVGTITGAVVLGTMGMPPLQDIGTSYRDGVAVKSFACFSVGCIAWPESGGDRWGLAPLRGLGAALGPEMRLSEQTFTDHAAYLAAHAAVAADPALWFASPEDAKTAPADDGMRLVVVVLPSVLAAGAPGDGVTEDPARAADLAAIAGGLLDGTGGTVQALHGAASKTLWVLKDDSFLRIDGGTRGLPDLVLYDRTLRLMVPVSAVATVTDRAGALKLPPPDLGLLDAAIARAFVVWGEDTTCLPGCGSVDALLQSQVDASPENAPFWTLSYWSPAK